MLDNKKVIVSSFKKKKMVAKKKVIPSVVVAPVQKEKVILDDPNIFILVDESHRTQEGDLNKAMKKVFPSAFYLGFTGTPLMKKEKSTISKSEFYAPVPVLVLSVKKD